ncbi:MAG: hypothetical protein JWP91_1453 [Fibrobacteres bacterium]|nr:hypothetical protein [Fibrobacterota bacterium]
MKAFILFPCLFAISVSAGTKSVYFASGKMTDTVTMRMGFVEPSKEAEAKFDTVLILSKGSDSLRIRTYSAWSALSACGGAETEYGFTYESKSGIIGKSSKSDTVWTAGNRFPDSLGKLDSVPYGGSWLLSGRTPDRHERFVGIRAAIDSNYQGICGLRFYSMVGNSNQLIYYRSRGSFAKFQAFAHRDSTVVNRGVELKVIVEMKIAILVSDDGGDLMDESTRIMPAIGDRNPPEPMRAKPFSLWNILGRRIFPFRP